MTKKLAPKCLRSAYGEKYAQGRAPQKGVAYSSLGWLIPCCWVDPRGEKDFVDDGNLVRTKTYDVRKYPKYTALFTEELKLKNVDKVEDILLSKAWIEFEDALLNHPEECPPQCHAHCGIEEDISEMSEDVASIMMQRDSKRKNKHNRTAIKLSVKSAREEREYNLLKIEVTKLISKMRQDGMSDKYIEHKSNCLLAKRHYTDEEWKIFMKYKRMGGKVHE
tara:strand:- start:682 stop:1344 length:663 start_codon:yes stop_codon:yes gene_type:complete